MLWPARARAHDETVSTSDVRVDDRVLVWRVDVGMGGLEKVVKFPATGPDLVERDLQASKRAVADYLRRGLTIDLDGRTVTPEIGPLEPRYEPFIASGQPYIARVVLELRYPAGRDIERIAARMAFFSDLTSQHRAVVTVRWGDRARQMVRLGPSDIDLDRASFVPSRWGVLREFALWGMEHIFIGFDHIAFLIALLLVARGWGELLKIVTSFTVAHSLTLLMAATDTVRIPSQVTEVLIAASIVYVAAENLWLQGRHSDHRWWLTFLFGLVHGLGFATQLRERLSELPGSVLFPVVSFNLGVELGQVVIVAAAFPMLLLLRRSADPARQGARRLRVVRFGSVPIMLLGVGWLVQRLVGS